MPIPFESQDDGIASIPEEYLTETEGDAVYATKVSPTFTGTVNAVSIAADELVINSGGQVDISCDAEIQGRIIVTPDGTEDGLYLNSGSLLIVDGPSLLNSSLSLRNASGADRAKLEVTDAGTNGGDLVVSVKDDGGSLTERLRLTQSGATVAGTVVTPDVASSTANHIDIGSGTDRRMRIEDKSSANFSEIEIRPVRTAAGISSNVEPINSYIQLFAQNGASDMTLFSEDMIQIRTNSNSYIRVTPTEAICTSPFTVPNTIITSGDSPWLTSPIAYTSNLNGLTLRHSSFTSDTAYWNLACSFNGAAQTGNLHFTFGGVRKGYLAETTYVGAIDFTGQHRSQFEGEFTQELVGLIVESTGAYLELDGSVAPTIDEALPSVRLTGAAKSKRVYGVLSGIEGETREYGTGFVTVLPKDDGVTRVIVNSVGEGSLWVVNTTGNLENGDYLCSSAVAGYAERQEDDLLHSYTVAKVTMDLDWSNLPPWLQTRRVNADGTITEDGMHLCAFVGCTYHCG
jgi:hypothetical protein